MLLEFLLKLTAMLLMIPAVGIVMVEQAGCTVGDLFLFIQLCRKICDAESFVSLTWLLTHSWRYRGDDPVWWFALYAI